MFFYHRLSPDVTFRQILRDPKEFDELIIERSVRRFLKYSYFSGRNRFRILSFVRFVANVSSVVFHSPSTLSFSLSCS